MVPANPKYHRPQTPYEHQIAEAARRAIVSALRAHDFNIAAAARSLGMQRTYLHLMIRELKIPATGSGRPWGKPLRERVLYRQTIRDATRKAIVDALVAHGGNRTRAARALGITRDTLKRIMRRFNITIGSQGPGIGRWTGRRR